MTVRNGLRHLLALGVLALGASFGIGCTSAETEPPPAPTPTPYPTPQLMGEAPVDQLFASPDYGVHTFMWWKPERVEFDLALVDNMGFNWVKQKFSWREIESIEKGSYDWYRPDRIVDKAEAAGLNLVVRLDRQPFWSEPADNAFKDNQPPADLQDFADFCGTVAERYAGRIQAYQVWNEPNLSREWGEQPPNPAEYTELLKVCYEAIKAADPDAIVISAGLAPTGTDSAEAMPDTTFLQGMYDAGAAEYFDVLGLNAPGFKAPPEMSPDETAANPEYGGGRWAAFRHVEDMRDLMVRNGDDHKQVAILEMGWTLDQVNPAYQWFAVDEETQADYLVRAYQYAKENWQPWIGLMTTVYISDYNWTPEEHEQWWWAIVLPDGTPRMAYHALAEMEK